ncbi:DarT ssDNA thymidine ADP-ribosyltransferase family protein [Novosphingobium soli]|uniref:DarT ssDNA thymidine ADP-ribosyltransferase family protein n=1 Tax=Novosphingobium soli TaxID=574956 RepID=A0ABV6CQT5_9SPHN
MPAQAIQAQATTVRVPYLLHFTRAVNLPSIMAHGIYPIGRATEVGASPAINDQYRFDGHRNSTSVSIGFPNCQMLYKYRKADEDVEWAILILPPSILWGKKCAFCRHNAADGRISGQPLANLMAPAAFVGMYEEIDGITSRVDQKLKPYDPTDVQAEVLVFDVIEPQYVTGVIFEKEAAREKYVAHLGGRKTYIHANNKGMFANRKYARTWGN